jgi:hypothetical protein
MNELSLTYYISICKGNAEMLATFKTLLLEDFKSIESRFFSAAEDNNIKVMRGELHKMHPIALNLNFQQLLDLIEKYRHCDPADFSKLHDELKICLTKTYDFLNSN